MKTHKFLIYLLLLTGILLNLAGGCKKVEDKGIPVLTTTTVTDITQTTAKSGGIITSEGGAAITASGVCWSTSSNPDISDSKTTDGHGPGNFVSTISGLIPDTTYYVRAYATNSEGTGYGNILTFKTKQTEISGTFTDPRDGNIYPFVTIGNQIWMAENLRYLPRVSEPASHSVSTPVYYVYGYNDTNVSIAKSTANYITYGVLYNWPAALAGSQSGWLNPSGVRGVCPAGWHLPSELEWIQLIEYLGGAGVTGGKLKETGTTHWNSPNTGATNEAGFTALPGGNRNAGGTFYGLGIYGNWWSATGYFADNAKFRYMNNNYSVVGAGNDDVQMGFSVRCVRD
jgi:uncharacterized protein (TIGR02145 family)